jgi:hypothetical protein
MNLFKEGELPQSDFCLKETDFIPNLIRKDIFNESIFQENDERAFLLYNILTEDECQYIIEEAEKIGFNKVLGSEQYRLNYEMTVRSQKMSDAMWKRISNQIKTIILTPDDYKQTIQGYKVEGLWEPVGFNTRWRVGKYFAGGHFGPHYDGSATVNDNLRSLKTFNLYLNGGLSGGTTNFVKNTQSMLRNEDNLFAAQPENISEKIVPVAGMALIFNHYILHEGEGLLEGLKYILRSDIMFQRNEPPQLCDSESKALNYLEQAKVYEREGEFSLAVACYGRAFKLCPKLQNNV